MKNLNPHFDKAIPTEEDCKRIRIEEEKKTSKLTSVYIYY